MRKKMFTGTKEIKKKVDHPFLSSSKPLLSVIIPAYCAERTLDRAIASVYLQNFKNRKIEVLVVIDDNSINYSKIMCRWPSVKWIKPPQCAPTGAGPSRNRGIELAKGAYICFLDADDEWAPNFLNSLMGLANKWGAGVGITQVIDQLGAEVLTLNPGRWLTLNDFGLLAGSFFPLIRKDIFVEFGNEPAQDVFFVMQIVGNNGGRIPVSKKAIYKLNLSINSETRKKQFAAKIESSYRRWQRWFHSGECRWITQNKIAAARAVGRRIALNRGFNNLKECSIFYKFLKENGRL